MHEAPCAVEARRPMEICLGELNNAIDVLQGLIINVNERLYPVLLEDPIQKEVACDRIETKRSDMENALVSYRERIESASAQLSSIYEGLRV